jgi:hypothetical protein
LVEKPGAPATAAYYLLRSLRLLAADAHPFATAAVSGADLSASWQGALIDYKDALVELHSGRLIAAGVPSDAEDITTPQLSIPAPCNFCDYGTLCGIGVGG